MHDLALEIHVGRDFLRDNSANSTRLRIPFHMVAAFE